MVIKAVVLLLLLTIVASMGSALFFMMKDKGDSDRMVRALTVRISLSIVAFLLIIAGYFLGLIEPNSPY